MINIEKDMTTFCGTIENETPKAYLIADGLNKIWLPRRKKNGQELIKVRIISGSDAEITLPAWLAKAKGII